jgi:hypothetical protein
MKTILRDWDRFLTYLFFIFYGAYSVFFPLISVDKVSEHWVEILLGTNFVFAGVSMFIGLLRNSYMVWKMGVTIAFIGLSTISLLVGIVGGPPALGAAFLFGAFATDCLYGVRRERRRREQEAIRRDLEAIIESVKPEGVS